MNEVDVYKFAKRLNLESSVTYLGVRYGIEKEAVFEQADIFAMPSFYHNECFPLVLLEAMQYSLPIVSTFEGGIPDVVEDGITGFLVPQRNAQILSEKLEILVNDALLRINMGCAGRAKYEKEFTSETFENSLTNILKSFCRDEL